MDRIRRTLRLSSILIILCVVPTLPSSGTLAGEPPALLLAAAVPYEHTSAPVNWVDDLEQRLKTYFTKKYASSDFTPYEQELNRIRSAVSRGDRWSAKREVGVFLNMLAHHAYGLGDDAAEELAGVWERTMPEQEFGIIYPGTGL